MKESFTLIETISATPEEIYTAWLSSEKHTLMTGGEATAGNTIGSPFTAWDGYIWGENIELIENQKIVQSWRTTEFAKSDEASQLIIELMKVEAGTEVTLTHSNIPEGQTQYKQGWIDHYFNPMKNYFGEKL